MLNACLRKISGLFVYGLAAVVLCGNSILAEDVARREVEGQPLAANIGRLLQTLDSLGSPMAATDRAGITKAISAEDGMELQTLLDPLALFVVEINPELRVKVRRGPGDPLLQQGGYTPFVIKIINDATLARVLNISSPQAGAVYGGAAEGILLRHACASCRGSRPQPNQPKTASPGCLSLRERNSALKKKRRHPTAL